jgi:hypothetical protein
VDAAWVDHATPQRTQSSCKFIGTGLDSDQSDRYAHGGEYAMKFHLLTRWPLMAALVILALTCVLPGCSGQSYSCGTADTNHCYGIVNWTGSYSGVSTEMTVVPLASGDIFVDDEEWLVDYFSTGDALSSAYWVETGIWNEGFGTDYFWANNTANAGFMSYDLGPVSQADLNADAQIVFTLHQDSATPSQWNVTISRPAGPVLFMEASTDNPMTPNTVIEGQELAGSSGAEAQLAFFEKNAFFQGNTKTIQSTDGTVCVGEATTSVPCPSKSPPPMAGWWPTLAPSVSSSDGGYFFTWCC